MGFQVDRRGGEAVGARHGELAGELFDLVARPAEPDAAMLAQRPVHRDRKTALRPGRAAPLVDRHAVRDDDQPAHRTVTPATVSTRTDKNGNKYAHMAGATIAQEDRKSTRLNSSH